MTKSDDIAKAASVSAQSAQTRPTGEAGSDAEAPPNEIVQSATLAKSGEEAVKDVETNRAAWIAAGVGVGVGIGSAALVAALLYANRGKKDARRR